MKKFIKIFTPILITNVVSTPFLLTSCGNDPDKPDPEKTIVITADSTEIEIEKTIQLHATLQDKPITVNWSVDKPNLASIDENGILTTIDGGSIIVKATSIDDPSCTGQISLTISGVAVQNVYVSQKNSKGTLEHISRISLNKNKTKDLYADIYPSSATHKEVSWLAEDDDIATISSQGMLNTKDIGVTNISATSTNNKVGNCAIEVYDSSFYNTRYQDWIGYWLWGTDKSKLAKAIVIPNDLTYIIYIKNPDNQSVGAFENYSYLESLYLPQRINGIGARAFYGCTNLRNIYYAGTISDWKNEDTEKDWHVYVPASYVHCKDGDAYIDEQYTLSSYIKWDYSVYDMTASVNSFENDKTSDSLVIPSYYELSGSRFKVTSIKSYSFDSESNIKFVSIPYSVSTIGTRAFENCNNLSCLILEKGISSIQSEAFANCTELDTIIYRGTKEQFSKITLGRDWATGIKATVVHCEDGDVSI